MDRRTICWILSFLAQLMFQAAAASPSSPSSPPSINCSVSQLQDGSIRYQLSPPPTSGKCETCWEDQNKTVLARDSNSVPDVVTVTNSSIVLKHCLEYLRYMWECNGVAEETFCIVNCSVFTVKDVQPPFWFCFSDSVCVCEVGGGLLIGALVAVIPMVVIIWLIVLKCKRRSLYEFPTELELSNRLAEGGQKRNEMV